MSKKLPAISKPDRAVATFARTWGFRGFSHVLANVATVLKPLLVQKPSSHRDKLGGGVMKRESP